VPVLSASGASKPKTKSCNLRSASMPVTAVTKRFTAVAKRYTVRKTRCELWIR